MLHFQVEFTENILKPGLDGLENKSLSHSKATQRAKHSKRKNRPYNKYQIKVVVVRCFVMTSERLKAGNKDLLG